MVITYQGHPLYGQSLPVVRMVRALGRPAVVVRFVDGQTAAIPLHWTDRHPALPALQIEGQPVRLHPGSLHELRTLVRELLISQASPAAKLDGAS